MKQYNWEQWYDYTGQLISWFYWLPNEPDINYMKPPGTYAPKNYAGFRVDGVNETGKWDDYIATDELNIVCTKTAGNGKNYGSVRLIMAYYE